MPTNDFWTNSQRQAWDYVKKAENGGMGQTEALRQYRAGGGAIRTSSWGELWQRYNTGSDAWDRLSQFKSSDTVPSSLFTQVGINYAERYTMTFTATVRGVSGDLIHNVHRQVSSDRQLTVSQWQSAAGETMIEDPSILTEEVVSVTDVNFYERMGVNE